MKQSQNAITFLRAQYSAVYGRAYIKGLASAMVMTSALLGFYTQEASAVEVPSNSDNSWDNPKNYDTDENKDESLHNLANGYYGDLTVRSGSKLGIRDIKLKGDLTIESYGKASLVGFANQGRNLYSWDDAKGQTSSDATGSLINGGTFNVGRDGQQYPDVVASHAYFKDITLKQGSKTFILGTIDSNQVIDDYSSLAGGFAKGNVEVESGSDITLKNNAQFTVAQGSNGIFDGVINLYSNKSGSNSFFRGEDNYSIGEDGSKVWTSGDAAKLIFGNNSIIRVIDNDYDDTDHGLSGIYAAESEFNGSVLIGSNNIKEPATLILDGDFIDTSKKADAADHGAGKFVANENAKFVIASGSRLIVGNGTYDVDNPNTPDVDESKLKTSLDLTKLHKNKLSGEGTLEIRGSVALTESVLNGFVSPFDDGSKTKGGLVALNDGVLELQSTDASQGIDISKYYIAADDEMSVADISVTGTDNTIKADKFLLRNRLLKKGNLQDKLTLEADELIMGGENTSSFDVKKLVAHKSVVFKDLLNNKPFIFNDKLILNGVTPNSPNNSSISSEGNVFLKSLYHVAGGEVTHKGELQVKNGGALTVGGATDTNNSDDIRFIESAIGHDASLTMAPDVFFSLASSKLTIEGNGFGSTSRVDISQLNPEKVSFVKAEDDTLSAQIKIGTNANVAKLSDAELIINDQQLKTLFSTIEGLRSKTHVSGTNFIIGPNGILKITDHDANEFTYNKEDKTASPDQVLLDVSLLRDIAQGVENNFILFQNGGRLEADKLQLRQLLTKQQIQLGKFESAQSFLNIGKGTVAANELQILNNADSELVVSNGILEVGSELKGSDKTTALVLGDANTSASTSGGAHLNLGHIAYTANANASGLHDGSYAYDVANSTQSGTINTAIVLNGATADDATLNVKLGTWKIGDSGSIRFSDSGRGSINVGMKADELLDPKQDLSSLKAELLLNTDDGLTVTSGNAFNIRDTGKSTLTKFKVNDGASSTIDGVLNVNEANISANAIFAGHGRINIGGVADSTGAPVTSASLAITQNNLNKFLTPSDPTNAPDTHGSLLFKENGILDFSADSSQVNIGNYNFAEVADPDQLIADINIAADKQLEVKALDLLIERSLADKSVDLTTNSTNLTLGGGNGFVSKDQALGLKELKTQNVIFVGDKDATGADTANAFSLKDTLNLRGQSADPNDSTQPLSGTSKGNVIVAEGATYHVQQGEYTHSGNMTIGGGKLQIGGSADLSENASLSVSGDFVIDSSLDSGSVLVKANELGGSSSLDLSSATNFTVKSAVGNDIISFAIGDDNVTAGSGSVAPNATLKIQGDHLSHLLGSGAAGVLLNATGQMLIAGDTALNSDVFAVGNAATSDKIVFNKGGQVTIDGQASLINTDVNDQVMVLGSGTVSVKDGLKLSGGNATLAQGILDVSSNNNPLLQGDSADLSFAVGDGSTSGNAVVKFHSNTTLPDNNTLDVGLSLNGNGDNNAIVNFDQGSFNAKDISVSGDKNIIELGDNDNNTVAVQLVGESLTIGNSASLVLKGNDADSDAHNASFTNVTLNSNASLKLNLDSLTINNGKGDFSEGEVTGKANIKIVGENALVSFKGNNFNSLLKDDAQFTLQDGASLNLKSNDFIDITQFAYDNDASGNGDIHVVNSVVPHVSQITGDKLTVSQSFNQNGTVIALGVTATDLRLGGGHGFDSIQALGLDSLNAQNVIFVGDKDANGVDTGNDFRLKDTLNLQGQSADPSDLSLPLTGTSNGDVIIADGGTYHVQQGDYTHTGDMTIDGGSLKIGGSADLAGDASLSINGNFAIDSNSSGGLIIKGNELGGKSTLDLSNATSINVTGSVFTSLEIGDVNAGVDAAVNASLKLNGNQLTDIFNMNGVGVLLNADGEIDASTSGTLILDGSQLQAGTQAVQGKLIFNNGGALRTNELSLTDSTINIGKGKIESNKLSLNNTNLGSGIFHVANELESTQDTIELNDGTDLILGRFELDRHNDLHPDSAVDSSSLGGNPASISSNLALNSGSEFKIIQGDWKLKDGSGDLIVNNDAEITIGAVNANGDAYQIYDANDSGSVVGASLTGNKITFNGDGSHLTINTSGQAKFNELDTSAGSKSVFDIKGTLDIANEVKLNNSDKITISGDLGVVHFGDVASHKITTNTDGTTLNVESGSFAKVFDLVNGGHLKLELEDQFFTLAQIKELRKTLLIDADNDGNVMDPTVHGFIHLGNAQVEGAGGGSGFNEIPFDQYNPNTGEIISGTDGIKGAGDGATILALSAENRNVLDVLADISDIRTNVGDDILLYDIPEGGVVKGNIGALVMKDGVSGNATIGSSVTLGHAYAIAGSSNGQRQFISGKDGSLRGADIQAGGALYLENGGHIGEINLASGSADDPTILTVNKRDPSKPYGSGDDGITYINSINGGANTRFDNNDVTHVIGSDVNIDELYNSSDLFVDSGDLNVMGNATLASGSNTIVSGDIVFGSGDAQTILSGADSRLEATNITFGNHTNLEGKITATGKVSTNMTNNAGSDFTLAASAILKAQEAEISATKLDLNGAIDLAQNGKFSGNVISLGSGSNITAAKGDLDFTATGAKGAIVQAVDSHLEAANVTFNGNTTLAGNTIASGKFAVSGGADNSFNLASGASVDAADADINSEQILLDGNMKLAQSGKFSGNVISLGSGSNITATKGDLDFTATGAKGAIVQAVDSHLEVANVTFNGNTTLAGNTIASGKFAVSGGTGNSFNLVSGASVDAANADINSDQILLDGNVKLAQNGKFSGNVISLGSGSNITATNGDLDFTATGAKGAIVQAVDSHLEAANVTFNGNTTLAGNTIASGKFAVSGGAGNSFNLASGASVDAANADINSDQIHLDGNMKLAQGGNFTGNVISLLSNSSVKSSGDLIFNASGSIGSFEQAANSSLSGANLNFKANKLDVSGTMTASQDIHIGTSGATNNADKFNLAYNANLTAGKDIYLDMANNSVNGTVAADQGTLYVRGSNNFFGNRSKVTAQKAIFQGTSEFVGNGKFSQSLYSSGDFTLRGMISTAEFDHTGIFRIRNGYLNVQKAKLNSNSTLSIQGKAQIGTLTAKDASSVIAVGGGNDVNGVSRVAAFSDNDVNTSGPSINSLQIDSLNLNGSKLVVSNDNNHHVSLLAVTGDDTNNSSTSNQLDGNLLIGKNSAMSWGSDVKTLQEDIAVYQNKQGVLSENSDKFGTILVINKPLKISSGSRIVLDHNADISNIGGSEGNNSDINGGNSAHELAALSDSTADATRTGSSVTTADLSMSEHSAIILKVDQLKQDHGAAIQFAKTGAKVSAENGSTIVLAGNYNARKDIEIFNDDNGSGVELAGSNIKVQSKSGIFIGELKTGDDVKRLTMTADKDVIDDLPVSDDVKDLINSYDPNSNSGFSGDNSYLNSAIANDPSVLDNAVRFDVFGGVVQATQAVSDYMTDTMLTRIGIGSLGTDFSTADDNHGNIKMWANPIYLRQNNKGFEAGGLNYGNKLDLYGLNTGVEVALTKQIKAGALINFGTGNSKGRESAEGVKNDFDYLGVGAYVSTQWDNFTLLGDVSFNRVRNDLENVNSIDKLTTSLDSKNFSVGVTGKFDLHANGFNISPYAGIRYQHFSFDDYELKGDTHGSFMYKKNDSLDVFELPVGVAISKTFISSSGWQFKPNIDLHLKANLGDRDIKGKVGWTGTNAVMDVRSEVFDPLSYGVNASFTAKKDNFTMGAGVGYTGSSNSSEFAVQANVSYKF